MISKVRLGLLFGAILVLFLFSKHKVSVNAFSKAEAKFQTVSKVQTNIKAHEGNHLLKLSLAQANKKFKTPEAEFSKNTLEDQLCYLMSEYPDLNLSPDSLVQLNYEIDRDEHRLNVYYINESRCPENTFSVLKIDYKGRIISYLDCRKVTQTQLFLASQFQYTLETVENNDVRKLDLAAVGEGYFLVTCPRDHQFYITRKGHFEYREGLLVNDDNCFLVNSMGRPAFLEAPEFPDQNGCFKSSNLCLGIVDVSQYDEKDFSFISKVYTRFNYKKNKDYPMIAKNLTVFNNSIENRYNEQTTDVGLPDWRFADVYFPPKSCE